MRHPPKKHHPLVVRFPRKELIRQLDVAARGNGRSRNAEIVYRLSESFSPPPAAISAAAEQK
jgi:hypothetical protein